MKKFVFLFLACVVVLSSISAQQLTWMPEVPNLKKSAEFQFGPMNEHDLIMGAGDILMFLDKQTLLPKQTLSIKQITKSKIGFAFFWLEHGWLALGFSCKNYFKGIDCHLTYNKLLENGFDTPINMASYPSDGLSFEENYDFVEVYASQNGKYVLHNFRDSFHVFNASYNVVYKRKAPDLFKINGKDAKRKHTKWFIDNDGNIFLSCVMEEALMRESELTKYKILFLKYDRQNDEFQHQTTELKNSIPLSTDEKANYSLSKKEFSLEGSGNLHTKYDPKTNRIVVAGLHEDQTGSHVFMVQYDGNNNRLIPLQKYAFPADLIEKISISSFKEKKVKGTVFFQDLILKTNGDAMMLLELDKSNVRPALNPALPNGGGNFDINILDIIYFNIGPGNELKYYGNIPKNQDNSKMLKDLLLDELSFAALAVGNDVHLIYNTLSREEGRELMDVKIDSNGQVSRKNLMTLDKGSAVMPSKLDFLNPYYLELVTDSHLGIRKPVQISENAIVLRARNGKQNSVLKISY